MCLDIVTTPKNLKSDGIGYKMLYKSRRGKLYFPYFMEKEVPLPVDKWINEKDYRLKRYKRKETISADGGCYQMGFHVYRNKGQAEKRTCFESDIIVRVKFRQAHTRGKQGGLNVIVAKEIFIQSEVKHG